MCVVCLCFFFFFQAEDCIRDYKVTGVQTCALPIWSARACASSRARSSLRKLAIAFVATRSEERRVGKECRSWWSPYHEKKKAKRTSKARTYVTRDLRGRTTGWSREAY